VVEVRDLSFRVLRRISFSVETGAVVGIVGKNGAGKTTLLKSLGGFYPYSGSVKVDGVEVRELPPLERVKTVNYLPQDFYHPFPFTVYEFLKATTEKDDGRIYEVLKKLGILKFKNRLLHSLSGGEKVKVHISRLLLVDPEVFLLDEPVAYLDISVSPFIENLVRELSERGKTVFITSHDVNFLYGLCDLFLGLKEGELSLFGGREELLKKGKEVFGVELKLISCNGETFIKTGGGGK